MGRAGPHQLSDAPRQAEVSHFDLALAVQEHIARLREGACSGDTVCKEG